MKHVVRTFAWIALLFLPAEQALAQPTLLFDRIDVSWPIVTLSFSVKCGTTYRFDLTTANFQVIENGSRIDTFTIFCPDPNSNCCSSVSLVFDRSGSMGGGSPTGLDGAKTAGKAFVDAMDPDGSGCDEATLISFDTQVTVDVFMTNDKVLLKQGIDGLVAQGGTAVWDAGVMGILELTNNGTQPCRAVILLTDGEDNASANTPDDIISLASMNRIRVFTIGLGSGINDADLQRIATGTGGKYYKVVTPSGLTAVMLEISALIHGGYRQCTITYPAQCADGTRRNVDLTLKNLVGCPGADTKTKSYRALRDTSSFQPVTVSLGWDTVRGGPAAVPIRIDPLPSVLPELQFTVNYDTACARFVGVQTSGFALAGVPLDLQPVPGGLRVSTIGSKVLTPADSDTLLLIRFSTLCGASVVDCPVGLNSWTFATGCLIPTRASGGIHLLPCEVLIEPADQARCQGDTARFFISNIPFGALSRQWESSTDNGATWKGLPGETRDTLILAPVLGWMRGTLYRVAVQMSGASSLTSREARLSVPFPVRTSLQPADLPVCEQGSGIFTAAPDRSQNITRLWQVSSDSGASWRVPSGNAYEDTLKLTLVPSSMSGHRYRIIYGDGCGYADTSRAAILTVVPPPRIAQEPRDTSVCENDTAWMSVASSDSTTHIQWQVAVDASSPFIDLLGETNGTLQLSSVPLWHDHYLYRAVLVHPQCGVQYSRVVLLTVRPDTLRILRAPAGAVICEGDSVTLDVLAAGATGYQWMMNGKPISGAVTPAYTIRGAKSSDWGYYSVRLSGSCNPKETGMVEVAVHAPPAILIPPDSYIKNTGDSVRFSVGISPGYNLRYQWLKDGVPISGETGRTLLIFPVKKSDEGAYRVIVAGDCGKPDTSAAGRLSVTIVGVVEKMSVPEAPVLHPVHPNPFRSATTISFDLPRRQNVALAVYDLFGRKTALLLTGEFPAGRQTHQLREGTLPAGSYILMLRTESGIVAQKMTLLR